MDYPDGEYTDEEEVQDNYLDEQREMYDEQGGGNYPIAKKPESLFSLFNNVWKSRTSSKIANLDKDELGSLGVSVRDCQRISLLSELLHHKKFADYFIGQGEITLATSMSKKGWFVELFVTSKKFAQKGTMGNLTQNKPQKWRIFGKPTEEKQPQNQ